MTLSFIRRMTIGRTISLHSEGLSPVGSKTEKIIYKLINRKDTAVHMKSGPVPMWGSYVSSLYVLDIKPLSEVSLANMFSHIVGSLFILMLFSLAMQKLFNLMRSHLFILSFMSLVLGDISVKMLLHGMSEIFLPMFSSRTCIVSQLIFKSFIHLEFIFVCGVSR